MAIHQSLYFFRTNLERHIRMKAGRKSQLYLLLCCLTQMFSLCHSEDPGTLYFGFFFDETTADYIKAATDVYLNSTLLFPAYHNFLQNISSKAGIENALNYYTKPLDPNTLKFDPNYHVTLKYCGSDQEACKEYEKKHAQHINQTFELQLVGFVLTNRTFGIRVHLTDDQLPFFDTVKADYSVSNQVKVPITSGTLDLEGIRFEPLEPFPPSLPASNSKAHVTLGCGPGIPAVITGPDLGQAIEYESGGVENVTSVSYDIPDPFHDEARNMLITQYIKEGTEDPVFVVYPRVKIVANAKLLPYKMPSNSAGSITSFTTCILICIFLSF